MATSVRSSEPTTVSSELESWVLTRGTVAEGDTLLALFFPRRTAGMSVTEVPTGWTLVRSDQTGVCSGFVYKKTATGSEPTTYTWKLSQVETGQGAIVVVKEAAAVLGAISKTNAGKTPHLTGLLATTGPNLLISAFFTDGASPTWTGVGTNTFTELIDSPQAGIPSALSVYSDTAGGAENAQRQAQPSATGEGVAIMVALTGTTEFAPVWPTAPVSSPGVFSFLGPLPSPPQVEGEILPGPVELVLSAAVGQSADILALTAPTALTLSASAAQSSTTLALTAPTTLALTASAAISTATLALTTGEGKTPVELTLSAVAATSTAALALTVPTTLAMVSSGQSTAALTVSHPQPLTLGASAGQSSATLSIFTPLALSPALATSTASLTFSVPRPLTLGKVEAQSAATLTVGAGPPILVLQAAAQSEAALAITAPTKLAPSVAASSSTASLTLKTSPVIAGSSAAQTSASLALIVLPKVEGRSEAHSSAALALTAPALLSLAVVAESSTATLTVTGGKTRWEEDPETRWEEHTKRGPLPSTTLYPSAHLYPEGEGEFWAPEPEPNWEGDTDTRWPLKPELTRW